MTGARVLLPVFATGRVELLFHFGDAFETAGRPDDFNPLPAAAVLGARAKPYWQAAGPRIDWFLAALTPRGCRRLLRQPLARLWGADFALADMLGTRARDLYEALRLAESFQARVALFEAWISECDANHGGDASVMELARMARTGEVASLDAMRQALAVGERRLHQRFVVELGITPKVYLRLLRFGRHVAALHPAPWLRPDDADSSVYVDDSHAIRDFREFAGTTPGAWRRGKSARGDPLVFTGLDANT